MKHLLLLIVLCYTIGASAQTEVRIGALGTNYIYKQHDSSTLGLVNQTDGEIAVHLGLKTAKDLFKLFEVQGDTATVQMVVGVDAYYGTKSKEFAIDPYSGIRLDFPLFLEYGIVKTFKRFKSYFESGIKLNDDIKIFTKLMNFNPYYDGDLTSYDRLNDRVVKLKRTIVFGLTYTF